MDNKMYEHISKQLDEANDKMINYVTFLTETGSLEKKLHILTDKGRDLLENKAILEDVLTVGLESKIEALQNWIEFHILSKDCDCDADSDGFYKCLKCSYGEEFDTSLK